jgi:hypothetical protein
MAKHCGKCNEEFEDWAEICPDCNTPLEDGPAPAAGGDDEIPLAPGPTKEELETFQQAWVGSAEDAENMIALLLGEGIRAIAVPDVAFDPDTAPPVRILVPPEHQLHAIWFIRGFERALEMFGGPPPDEPKDPE